MRIPSCPSSEERQGAGCRAVHPQLPWLTRDVWGAAEGDTVRGQDPHPRRWHHCPARCPGPCHCCAPSRCRPAGKGGWSLAPHSRTWPPVPPSTRDGGTVCPLGDDHQGGGTHLFGDTRDSAGVAACPTPLPLHQGEVVASAQPGLEEEGGPAAAEPALRDDGGAVPQQLRLVHVVGGQDDGAAWGPGMDLTPDPLAGPIHCRFSPPAHPPAHPRLGGSEGEGGPPALTFAVLEQQLPDAAAGEGVDAGRGLVQDDHPGAAHEGDGHRELPLHPACRGTALGGLGATDPHSGTQPGPRTHPRGSWSAPGACAAAPCPGAAAPSPPAPAAPRAPSAARRTRRAPPPSG